jgi:hypothetical protein
MGEEIVTLLIQDGGWEAVAVILSLLILWKAVQALLKVSENLDKATANNAKMAVTLDDIEGRVQKLREMKEEEKIVLSSAILDMKEISKAHGEELEKVPEKVKIVMTPLLDEIPGKIAAVLSPELRAMQEDLILQVNNSFKDFSAQVDGKLEGTPEKTVEKMEERLKKLEDTLISKITELITNIQEKKE